MIETELQPRLVKTEHELIDARTGFIFLLISDSKGVRVKRTPYKEGSIPLWGHGVLTQWCVAVGLFSNGWTPAAMAGTITYFPTLNDAVEFIKKHGGDL